MSFYHSPSVPLLIQKEYSREYTKTHIALWRGNTIHETTSQTQTESTTSWLCGHRVYRKDDPRDSQTHMNSWCLLILIMNIPKKALPLICGRFFSLFFGTSEDPLLSFTVSSKSTHSLPIGPDLHMKWYPSFSSTLAPLSTHMPGSEEAGKAHNWSVSLGWKSVTKVSPPRSTQEWLQIQIYCKLKWKFCRANTKHFFFLHDPDKKESTNMLQFLLKMFCFALRKNISSHNLKLHFKTA